MKTDKILKIISALCMGAGVGVCFGVAMSNILMGLLMGIGVSMCYAVAFTSNSSKDQE